MLRRLLLLPLPLCLLLPGCGGYQPPTIGACSEGKPLAEADCPDDGFEATDRCFQTLAAACECLSCPPHRCTKSDSKPAEVSCSATAE